MRQMQYVSSMAVCLLSDDESEGGSVAALPAPSRFHDIVVCYWIAEEMPFRGVP
jgi:hypothetical protein